MTFMVRLPEGKACQSRDKHAADVQARKELQEAVKALRKDRIPPTKVTKPAPKPKGAATKRKELVEVPQSEGGHPRSKSRHRAVGQQCAQYKLVNDESN